jgi:undecaprenyl-diphosphatase
MTQQLHAIVLGIIQGLTEFLPVSSSAHLIIAPWLLNWDDPGLAFDVALHLGTLLALLIFYWRRWLEMAASIANGDRANRRLLSLLIVASVPGAIIGVLLEKAAESAFRSPWIIGFTLGLMGLALWFFDRIEPQERTIDEIGLFDAILLGLSQAVAIIPGVSRSGATITMARIRRINRADAANFSFLMATPIIAGAGLWEGRHLIGLNLKGGVLAGFVASAIFGLAAIAGLISFVSRRSYGIFAWYRIALAVVVIAVAFARG